LSSFYVIFVFVAIDKECLISRTFHIPSKASIFKSHFLSKSKTFSNTNSKVTKFCNFLCLKMKGCRSKFKFFNFFPLRRLLSNFSSKLTLPVTFPAVILTSQFQRRTSLTSVTLPTQCGVEKRRSESSKYCRVFDKTASLHFPAISLFHF